MGASKFSSEDRALIFFGGATNTGKSIWSSDRQQGIWALEIESGKPENQASLRDFCKRWPDAHPMLIGPGGIPFAEFFVENVKAKFKA